MRKWFISLVLVGALGGGVTAGVPMHSSMNEGMMDCCKAALAHNDSPAAAAARLCCALNCHEPGTAGVTAQPGSIFAPVMVAAPVHFVAHDPKPTSSGRFVAPHSTTLQPAYILNLALLI